MVNLKMNIKKLSAVFLTMIVIATALVVSGCGRTVIDIKEARLLKVELEGFDGKGKVVISVNEGKLKTLKKEYRDKKNYSDIKDILDSITFEMEAPKINGTLSNGDKFNVVAKYDKEFAEEVGVELKNTTIECSVGDKLSKGIVVDAFKGVKIEYSGDNGDAYARVISKDCDDLVDELNIYFEIEGEKDNLKNGDKLVVRANYLGNLEEKGYFLKEETKEFIVDGLAGVRETLDGVEFSGVAADMRDKLDDYLKDDYHLANLSYTFESGKNRDLSTYKTKFTPKYELIKYAYAYDADDLADNALVAYYKITTEIERTETYNGAGDEDFKDKGSKDIGVSYIAVRSSSLKVKGNNKIDDENITFSMVSATSIERCDRELKIDDYKFEYYDSNYKKLDSTTTEATEPATEKPTENATEATTEATTEEATDKATEKADEKTATEATTEKATDKKEN